MQAMLTLGMIYGVDSSTSCLFQQLFAQYLMKALFRPFMVSRDSLKQLNTPSLPEEQEYVQQAELDDW